MKNILSILVMLAFAACDDFIEKDISNSRVNIVAPVDGVTSPAGIVTFLWCATEGASAYKVTVLSPSFAAASTVVADTLMRNDSLSMKLTLRLTLAAGDYQWSIRALNDAYATPEQIYTFFVAGSEEEPEP